MKARDVSQHDLLYARDLARFIWGQMRGLSVQLTGMILAKLMATYLLEWPPEQRAVVLAAWVETVKGAKP